MEALNLLFYIIILTQPGLPNLDALSGYARHRDGKALRGDQEPVATVSI